ncbi:MAG TPA: M1 family metallopeptidase [Longimicrobiaceae bacterium]|nr:M1 family metallopeptidase [Longimicrobiaceae bacterium]
MISLLLALATAAPQDTGYFQQGVDYRIEARLDDQAGVLHGRARLRYTNHSRTPLDSLYVHQHLNAFRPNSAWARRELTLGNRRFQDLGPADHAYERFTRVQVDGRDVRPAYPGAPDSTVAVIPLAAPLRPGASVTVTMDWEARPSTLPRRQGRRGRHLDWAQWYPRIAVFDHTGWAVQPLLPQGEFYGEFAAYDVLLDVAADQVIGATGVAVEGNPGWEVSDFERRYYPARPFEPLGLLDAAAGAGRKRVRFRADSVHHFAWSADPRFVHEGVTRMSLHADGTRRDLPPIHVLFWPEDRGSDWEGAAARRTYDALAWLQGIFGPYPWPQLTNLHRLESGGTEFPMLVMDGSASEGLIVHEVTHQYLHGIFANNEWREGWMDEGFTSFIDAWYEEEKGTPDVWYQTMVGLERLERTDSVQPIALPGADYVNPRIYSAMTYTKASAVFRMLRELLGEDTFRRVLREFYARHRLKHVTGADFQRVAEDVSGQELDWFFGQWIERTDKLDYAVAEARAERLSDGRWRTRVVVTRTGEAWMPVTLQVRDVRQTLTSRERRQVIDVISAEWPDHVALDPDWVLIDVNRANNHTGVQ